NPFCPVPDRVYPVGSEARRHTTWDRRRWHFPGEERRRFVPRKLAGFLRRRSPVSAAECPRPKAQRPGIAEVARYIRTSHGNALECRSTVCSCLVPSNNSIISLRTICARSALLVPSEGIGRPIFTSTIPPRT